MTGAFYLAAIFHRWGEYMAEQLELSSFLGMPHDETDTSKYVYNILTLMRSTENCEDLSGSCEPASVSSGS